VPAPPPPTPAEPFLVRLGVRYFQQRSSLETGERPPAVDAVHLLNPDERAALRRIERGAIVRAALAGAISTVIAAAVEVAVSRPILGARPRLASTSDQIRFYAVVGAVTAITSIIEILYLYWDGLRAVHQLSREAGLDLFPDQDDDKAVASAMARAALEIPNASTTLFGVNPHREASRTRLLVASLVYKAKISVTNFLIKALVRRAFGRAFVRSWLPFVAVPFTALWNAVICWLIMREARIRAMGPSAAREMVEITFAAHAGEVSPALRTTALGAVASSIVRTEDLHPNLAALLREVAAKVGASVDRGAALAPHDDGASLDDTRGFLDRLRELDPPAQTTVLRILAVASIIDGRLTRAERRLLVEARTACRLGDAADLSAVERLRRAFVAGDPLDAAQITSIVARGSQVSGA